MDFFAGSLRRWLLVFAARVLRERRFLSFFTIRSAHEMNAGVVIVGWGEELYEQGKSRTAPQSQLTTKPTSMEEEGEQGFNGQGKKLFYLLCPLHHSFSPSFSFYLKISWLSVQMKILFVLGFHARINSLSKLAFAQIIRFPRLSNCFLDVALVITKVEENMVYIFCS